MRIVLIGDSHGHYQNILDLQDKENYDKIVFAGDGIRDVDFIDDDKCIKVEGNCDIFYNDYPLTVIKEFEGVRTLITHGHKFLVKYSPFGLIKEAKLDDCKLVLYGHTHTASIIQEDGIALVNGGSIANGSYAVIEIKNGKITAELKHL